MQPWRLIVVRDAGRRASRCAGWRSASACARPTASTSAPASSSTRRSRAIVEAPLGVCVCCDHGDPDAEVLGRGTIPETDVYSTACAIENLWLAARAEGLGVGWVSFYRPGRPARAARHPRARRPDRLPVPRLARRAPGAAGPGVRRLGGARAARRRRHAGALERRADAARRRRAVRGARPRRRDRRARPPRPARQAGRQPRRARAADRALGGDHRRAAAGARCAPACSSARPTTATSSTARACSTREVSAQVAAAAARGETAPSACSRARRRPRAAGRRRRPGRPDAGRRARREGRARAAPTCSRARAHRGAARRGAGGRRAARRRARRARRRLPRRSARSGSATRRRPPRSPARSPARRPRPPSAAAPGWTRPGWSASARWSRAALERHGAPLDARDALQAVGGLELAALAGADRWRPRGAACRSCSTATRRRPPRSPRPGSSRPSARR